MVDSEDGQAAGRPGGVHIGSADRSAVSIGNYNTVKNVNNHTDRSPDPVQAELLAAVRELRSGLALLVATDETARLGDELAATENEISESGAASRGRLVRLREALTAVGPIASGLSSAVAAVESIRTLLGG